MVEKPKLGSILVVIGALIGAVCAAILVKHHLDADSVATLCGPNGGCQKVNQSGASEILGLPTALWGFFFYAITLVIGVFYFVTKDQGFMQTAFALSLLAIFVDLLLFLYMAIKIERYCHLCLITYASTIAIFIGTFLEIKAQEMSLFGKFFSFVEVKGSILISFYSMLAVAIAIGAVIYSSSQKGETVSGLDEIVKRFSNSQRVQIDSIGAAEKGGGDYTALTIVEFADFQCPGCKYMSETLSYVHKTCPNLIKVKYMNLPLDKSCNSNMKNPLHQSACRLAEAAHCAKEQSKFWPMHDAIYKKQQTELQGKVEPSKIQAIAKSQKLNMGKFNVCLKNPKTRAAIQLDIKKAGDVGITGTPSTVINGRKFQLKEGDKLLLGQVAEKTARDLYAKAAKDPSDLTCKIE